MSLEEFLESKGAEYAPFDPNRFRNFYLTNPYLQDGAPRIVQVVGTNGKGTTGRFLAQMLKNAGLKVGHFTSPHILSFAERFWFDGEDAKAEELGEAFEEIRRRLLELEQLSYFEFLTTLAYAYFKDKADILILEAGVGGEYDSTSVFTKELLLVTPIGMDHTDMLGNSIEEIARTKLKASNCKTIIGFQPNESVGSLIKKEFSDRDILFLEDVLRADELLDAKKYADENFGVSYLAQNLALAYAGAKSLGVAVELCNIEVLRGRFERVADNIVVDAGHNVDAAKKIASELGEKKVVLVFNCYEGKDPESSLLALKNNIEKVEIIDIDSDRAISKDKLIKVLDKISVPYQNFDKIDQNREYLVFGSFSVAAEFLRRRFEEKK